MYGGLEGGATNSIFRIFNNNGKIMVETKGEGTNLSLMGVNRVVNIIYQLISKAYLELSRNLNNGCMESLGVALSGAETGNTIVKELEEALISKLSPTYLKKNFNNLKIISDIEGSLYAATNNNNCIVLISGTGSNCIFVEQTNANDNQIKPSSRTLMALKCGGGGHLIGDEGSAIYVSLLTLRILMQIREGRNDFLNTNKLKYQDINRVEECVYIHFGLSSIQFKKSELYPFLYNSTRSSMKTKVANLTKKLAKLALKENDRFCKIIFNIAGKELGEMVNGVLQQNSNHKALQIVNNKKVDIICIGSMFKSWALLQSAFVKVLREQEKGHSVIKRLLYVNDSSAIGAARYAVMYGLPLHQQPTLPLCKNVNVLYDFNENNNKSNDTITNQKNVKNRNNDDRKIQYYIILSTIFFCAAIKIGF